MSFQTHTIEHQVLDLVISRGVVTFAELNRRIGGFAGQRALRAADDENVILWAGMSPEAVSAITSLIEGGYIVCRPAELLAYLFAGKVPRLPIARRRRRDRYKTEHWLPVAFDPGPAAGRGTET